QFAFAADHQDRVDEYRFADVLAQSNAIAAELGRLGIKGGDRVGILMENIPQWVFVLLGSMRIGAVTVPLATTLPENSLDLIAHHAGCKIIFADEQNWEKARSVADAQGCALVRGDQTQISNLEIPKVPITPSDTAIIIYTSGTTGNPKGVELTFDNL